MMTAFNDDLNDIKINATSFIKLILCKISGGMGEDGKMYAAVEVTGYFLQTT